MDEIRRLCHDKHIEPLGETMRPTRKIIIGTGALLVPLALVTAIGPTTAWAKSTVQPGTVTCKSVTGYVKFSPGLTAAGGKSVKVTSSTTYSSCTATGGGISPTKGTEKSTSTASSNGCTAVLEAAPTTETFTTKWSPSNIASSTTIFPASAIKSSESPVSLTYGGTGTTGTGSYTGTDGGAKTTATVVFTQTVASITSACTTKAGLKELTIASGSATTG
jgi:hypothetical protein